MLRQRQDQHKHLHSHDYSLALRLAGLTHDRHLKGMSICTVGSNAPGDAGAAAQLFLSWVHKSRQAVFRRMALRCRWCTLQASVIALLHASLLTVRKHTRAQTLLKSFSWQARHCFRSATAGMRTGGLGPLTVESGNLGGFFRV